MTGSASEASAGTGHAGLTGSAIVEVPASSANLGPGFDALAVALDVVLAVTAVDREDRRVVCEGVGADELPTDDSNLVWRSLVAYCRHVGVAVPDVTLRTHNEIPLERGMGSSAAAAVAGGALGRALLDAGGADADLIGLAAELEGHADNAAAAVLGGLVICADGMARRVTPSAQLQPLICIPAVRQSTVSARAVLPESIALADAAANGARTAMVLAALSGAIAWEPRVMHDVLHEPARFEVMPASGRLVTALRAEGVGACLSGAGPSVLAIVSASTSESVATVRALAGTGWDVRAVDWHLCGASKVNGNRRRVGTSSW